MTEPIRALVELDQFEKYWAYLSSSSGALYRVECREHAARFLELHDSIFGPEGSVQPPVNKALNLYSESEFVATLRRWLTSGSEWPDKNAEHSMCLVWEMCNRFRLGLLKLLGAVGSYKSSFTSAQLNLQPRITRWVPHLPERLRSMPNPDGTIEALADGTTIVIFGDLRKSQELMLYSESPEAFFANMKTFIGETKGLLSKWGAVFDKFTGDGFLGYFCKAMARYGPTGSHVENFLGFLKELHAFSRRLFADWEKRVRKIPAGGYGLALGADAGIVRVDDSQDHLVCVGDAIVWAARMCSAAGQGETVVNVSLEALMKGIPGVSFQEIADKTKGGESFKAFKLT